MKCLQFLCLAASAACALPSPINVADSVRENQRYYFATASFDGGQDRARLRYSHSDADRLGRVLAELGGTQSEREKFLVEPSPAEFKQGLDALATQMKSEKGKARQEVIVYYSGHADDRGLILRGGSLSWKELRAAVQNLPADVRLSVIDACGSGAIIRSKGGVKRQAFLTDKDENLRGTAFLTSSSESEVSQESDQLRASFFTHALTSGLRGAADYNGDRKVTLGEAYQYAFAQTLQATEAASAGSQHPLRDMDLSGSGDLVLTDLERGNAGVILGQELHGLFWIYDPQQKLVAGVQKTPGRTLQLGLEPGQYVLKSENLSGAIQVGLSLDQGQTRLIDSAGLLGLPPVYAPQQPKADATISVNPLPMLKIPNAWEMCEEQGRRSALLPEGNDIGVVSQKSSRAQKGLQGSLIVAEADSLGSGVQLGLLGVAQAHQGWDGVQGSLFYSRSRACLNGVQLSNGLNDAQAVRGVQMGLFNMGASVRGVQGGVINLLTRELQGVQGGVINVMISPRDSMGTTKNAEQGSVQGGVINVARDADIQGGVVNIAHDTKVQGGTVNIAMKTGVQGGVQNIAHDTKVQGGVSNLAKYSQVQGGILNLGLQSKVQVGIMNVAKKSKLQVGLLNIADSVDLAVGLLNLSRSGIVEYTRSMDETGQIVYGLRSGNAIFYTHILVSDHFGFDDFGIEIDQDNDTTAIWGKSALGLGMGTRFGTKKAWWPQLEYQVLTYIPVRDTLRTSESEESFLRRVKANDLHRLNLDLGWNPIPFVGVTAGVSFNVLSTYGNAYLVEPKGQYEMSFGGHDFRAWPGIHAEIRIGWVGNSQWLNSIR